MRNLKSLMIWRRTLKRIRNLSNRVRMLVRDFSLQLQKQQWKLRKTLRSSRSTRRPLPRRSKNSRSISKRNKKRKQNFNRNILTTVMSKISGTTNKCLKETILFLKWKKKTQSVKMNGFKKKQIQRILTTISGTKKTKRWSNWTRNIVRI